MSRQEVEVGLGMCRLWVGRVVFVKGEEKVKWLEAICRIGVGCIFWPWSTLGL